MKSVLLEYKENKCFIYINNSLETIVNKVKVTTFNGEEEYLLPIHRNAMFLPCCHINMQSVLEYLRLTKDEINSVKIVHK